MIRTFGWRRVAYVTTNVDPNRAARQPLTERESDLVREHNVLDLDLYAWANDRFQRDVVGSAGFMADLETFLARNRRYGPFGRIASFPKDTVVRLRSR
jgi:hypothetical protein